MQRYRNLSKNAERGLNILKKLVWGYCFPKKMVTFAGLFMRRRMMGVNIFINF